jgi:hypothetical protein
MGGDASASRRGHQGRLFWSWINEVELISGFG